MLDDLPVVDAAAECRLDGALIVAEAIAGRRAQERMGISWHAS